MLLFDWTFVQFVAIENLRFFFLRNELEINLNILISCVRILFRFNVFANELYSPNQWRALH